eukprot:GHVT01069104.1.p1 GENE.GHVT01069104.1~~GHVT01069104.1.p1  ORF type:complete len:179 (-),score=32.60 GHVT01069104.1:271-807(-)
MELITDFNTAFDNSGGAITAAAAGLGTGALIGLLGLGISSIVMTQKKKKAVKVLKRDISNLHRVKRENEIFLDKLIARPGATPMAQNVLEAAEAKQSGDNMSNGRTPPSLPPPTPPMANISITAQPDMWSHNASPLPMPQIRNSTPPLPAQEAFPFPTDNQPTHQNVAGPLDFNPMDY